MIRKLIGTFLAGSSLIGCVLLVATDAHAVVGTRKTYTISGSVGEPGVTLRGFPQYAGTVVTDQDGWFSVDVYYGWIGTITPTLVGYTFQPSSRRIGPVRGPSEESFVSKLQTFMISGSVGIDGVVLQGFPEPVYPGNGGAYKVAVPYGWSGVVTPQKEGYEFTPPDKSYENVRADTSQTFRPAKSTYEVSGTITINGSPIAGVVLDGFAGPVKTDPSGRYRFKVDHEWSATVTPLMEGYEFSPPSIRHDQVVSPQLGQDFYASQIQYSVTGNVGIGGVEIRGLRGSVLSGPGGDFAAQVNHGQNIELTPHLEGYRFTPPKFSLTKIKSDKTIPSFVAQEIFIKLTGTVAGIEGVELTGMLDRHGQPVYTDPRGRYTCEVRYLYSGTMMLAKEGYEFDPPGVAFNRLTLHKSDVFKAKKVKYVIRGNTGRQRDVLLEGFPATVRSDAAGDYEVEVEYGFGATVTPKKEGLQFDPPYRFYEDVGTPQLQQDYEASEKEFIVSGRVTGKDGPMSDVDVQLGLGDPKNTVTDAEGRYRISLPYNWKGKLQVAKPGHTFMPLQKEVFGLKRDLTVDFKGEVKMMKITDILLDADGEALPQVMVTADNGGTSMLSGVDGKFTVEVPYGWSGSISFLKPGIEFGDSVYVDVIEDIDETGPIAPPPGDVSAPSVFPPPPPDRAPVLPEDPTRLLTGGLPPTERVGAAAGTPPAATTGADEAMAAQLEEALAEIERLRVTSRRRPSFTDSSTPPDLGGPRSPVSSSLGPVVTYTATAEDLAVVLQDFSIQTEIPIIIGATVIPPSVSGDFVNTPLDLALDILLAGTGLTWKKTDHYYLISPVYSTALEDLIDSSEVVRVKLQYMSASNAVSLLHDAYRPFVKGELNGRIAVITAPPAVLKQIVASLKTIDAKPRQVLLDARIVVMDKSNLLNLGIEWGWPTLQAGAFRNVPTLALGAGTTSYRGSWPWGAQIGFSPDGTFTNALNMTLNLMEENGQAQIIANPQVLAQDGEQATMYVIKEEYFMLTAPTQAGNQVFAQTELAEIQSGTKLDIIPYISDNNDITMIIAVELSDSIPRGPESELPVVTRRTAQNTVTVHDGGTVAIAGLSENRRVIQARRTPGFSRIPLLGKLFNNDNTISTSREVAIFITARIVPERGPSVYRPLPAPGMANPAPLTSAPPSPLRLGGQGVTNQAGAAPLSDFNRDLGRRLPNANPNVRRRPTSRY